MSSPRAAHRTAPGPAGSPSYWVLGGVGALAAIGLVALMLVFSTGRISSPDTAAAVYVVATNAKDTETVNQLTCTAQRSSITLDPLSALPSALQDQLKNVKARMTLKRVNQTTNTSAYATVELTVTGLPVLSPSSNISSAVELKMTKDADGWKMCGIRGIS